MEAMGKTANKSHWGSRGFESPQVHLQSLDLALEREDSIESLYFGMSVGSIKIPEILCATECV
jgi:hypothetical protein